MDIYTYMHIYKPTQNVKFLRYITISNNIYIYIYIYTHIAYMSTCSTLKKHMFALTNVKLEILECAWEQFPHVQNPDVGNIENPKQSGLCGGDMVGTARSPVISYMLPLAPYWLPIGCGRVNNSPDAP